MSEKIVRDFIESYIEMEELYGNVERAEELTKFLNCLEYEENPNDIAEIMWEVVNHEYKK